MHWAFLPLVLAFGLAAFVPGWLEHRRRSAVAVELTGFALLSGAVLAEDWLGRPELRHYRPAMLAVS